MLNNGINFKKILQNKIRKHVSVIKVLTFGLNAFFKESIFKLIIKISYLFVVSMISVSKYLFCNFKILKPIASLNLFLFFNSTKILIFKHSKLN